MSETKRILTIGSAGNTGNPCLLALRAKGYTLKVWRTKSEMNKYGIHYEAEKDGRVFIASNDAELLGLVAMWEVRGDDWRTKPGEPYIHDELYPTAITYDSEGNAVEVGGVPIPKSGNE